MFEIFKVFTEHFRAKPATITLTLLLFISVIATIIGVFTFGVGAEVGIMAVVSSVLLMALAFANDLG